MLNAVLVGFEAVNIAGAPIATCVCYVVMIGMNVFFLRKYLAGCGAIFRNVLKTAAAALLRETVLSEETTFNTVSR